MSRIIIISKQWSYLRDSIMQYNEIHICNTWIKYQLSKRAMKTEKKNHQLEQAIQYMQCMCKQVTSVKVCKCVKMRRWQCKRFTFFSKTIFSFQDSEILNPKNLTQRYFDYQKSLNTMLLEDLLISFSIFFNIYFILFYYFDLLCSRIQSDVFNVWTRQSGNSLPVGVFPGDQWKTLVLVALRKTTAQRPIPSGRSRRGEGEPKTPHSAVLPKGSLHVAVTLAVGKTLVSTYVVLVPGNFSSAQPPSRKEVTRVETWQKSC